MTAAAEAAREMALAELLGEVDRGASDTRVSSENGHRNNAHAGPSFDLHLGALAITTNAGDADEAAFARLLGVGAGDDEGSLDVQLVKYADHDVVRNVMRACGSADLHEKARVVTARLKAVELESIQEYVAESANLTQLHDQINVCDTVLGSMELLLKEFKDDLGKIGGEIKDLQTQSNGMSVKLSNRKLANAILGDFVREITVDETLIKHIVEDQVSEEYMKHMVKVDRKLRFVKNDPRVAASAAGAEILPELARLRAKAATKARDFLLTKLHTLRQPKTNVQVIQQNVLLKYKYLVFFLKTHVPEVLVEIKQSYAETMSSLLKFAVAGHARSLAELAVGVGVKNEMLVPEEGGYDVLVTKRTPISSSSGLASTSSSSTSSSSPFVLGRRADVLDALETSPPLVTHIAQSSGTKLRHEKLFRSAHKLLMDTMTFEFLFCREFFACDAGDAERLCLDMFTPALRVMETENTLVSGLGSVSVAQDLIRGGGHDVVALVLMLRINAEHQSIMRRRNVPCLDRHLHGVELALWPKLKHAFDAHVASVTRAARDPASVTRLWKDDVRAHPIVVRFADLTSAMLSATGDALSEFGQIELDVERLRDAIAALIEKLAAKFVDPKRAALFTGNCADKVCATLTEAVVIGPLDGQTAAVGGNSLKGCPTYRFFDAMRDKAKRNGA